MAGVADLAAVAGSDTGAGFATTRTDAGVSARAGAFAANAFAAPPDGFSAITGSSSSETAGAGSAGSVAGSVGLGDPAEDSAVSLSAASSDSFESLVAAVAVGDDFDEEFAEDERVPVEFAVSEAGRAEIPEWPDSDVAEFDSLDVVSPADCTDEVFADDDDSEDAEPAEGLDVSAEAAPQSAAIATPIPSATANPPTRPIYAPALIYCEPFDVLILGKD